MRGDSGALQMAESQEPASVIGVGVVHAASVRLGASFAPRGGSAMESRVVNGSGKCIIDPKSTTGLRCFDGAFSAEVGAGIPNAGIREARSG